jgi:adenylate cyclase
MRGWAWIYRPRSGETRQQAQQAFERALAIDPQSIGARIGLGQVLIGNIADGSSNSPTQDGSRAEKLLLEALQGDPNSSTAHYALGVLCRVQNRLPEAQIEFETAIALDRNNASAFQQLGIAIMFLGRPEAGIPFMEKALRLDPRNRNINFYFWALGYAHLLLDHKNEAVDLLIKARNSNPGIFYNHLCVASALALRGDVDEAKTALAEGIKLKPEVNSLARWRERFPWGNAQYAALFEKTVAVGLRRAGFPDE